MFSGSDGEAEVVILNVSRRNYGTEWEAAVKVKQNHLDLCSAGWTVDKVDGIPGYNTQRMKISTDHVENVI